MCGISGIFYFDDKRVVDFRQLKLMTDILTHRGPDGEGLYIKNNIGLGHRRLSIIDLETGNQPMFNEDKSIVIVLNGEIYNYIELRNELKKLGHIFRTTSDTEVIIRAYEEWGVAFQDKLNGMWAFALWDERKHQLFLSRDRIGEKPLNYAILDNTLIFSSEIKSLFTFGISKEIRPELIETYLVLTHIPCPNTFYKNVFKMRPGHFIIADSSGIKEQKYWDLPEIDESNMLKDKSHIYDEFSCIFEDSVKIGMRSDVPFGAFLSGGLDSSSIVALMSKNSKLPIETFTVGFCQKDFDESELARLVSDKFNTNHHPIIVRPLIIDEAIKKAIFHFDEPFGDSSAIPTYQVSNFASQRVRMVLTGDGGDEVLSGYDSYAGIKFSYIFSQFPNSFQKLLPKGIDSLSKVFNGSVKYKMNHVVKVLETAGYPFVERMANKFSFIPLSLIKKLTTHIKDCISIEDYLTDVINKIPYQDDFYRLMYFHFKFTLPDDFLVKVDRMSMANSIEVRAPFLDHRLINFMIKVDKNIKMQGWERKSILRKTVGKELPYQLLKSPKKGFTVPVRDWFRDDAQSHLLQLKKVEIICNKEIIEQIIHENHYGISDNGNFLWTLIMLNNCI